MGSQVQSRLGPSWADLVAILGRYRAVLDRLGAIFIRILGRFGKSFGSSYGTIGAELERPERPRRGLHLVLGYFFFEDRAAENIEQFFWGIGSVSGGFWPALQPFGPSWGGLGTTLNRFRAVLGRSLVVLGLSWPFLGHFGAVLRRF